MMRIPASRICCCGYNIQIHTDYRNPVEEKGWQGHSLKRRAPWPLPWQAFIVFLGPLHQRWSSFTMHRFVFCGYLLQTKERVWLNTSKEDICNVKGEMVKWLCPIPGRSSPDFGKIKILSKHLLPQGEGVLARASLIAVNIQCRPDFPLENLSMDVGPARQPHSPLAFLSGGWATFPTLGTVPHTYCLD